MTIITNAYTKALTEPQRQSLGLSEQHIAPINAYIQLHRDVHQPWQAICAAAQLAGFELSVASGYRSFARQQRIWNRKLSGQTPVYNSQGQVVDVLAFAPLARLHLVLRWSAIPGASRHHWGSDMDIYDQSAVADDYVLQLVPEEYQGNGPFAPMMQWLREYLGDRPELGFFFPYQDDHGGVAPEPWHLSFAPVAAHYQSLWCQSHWLQQLHHETLEDKDTLLAEMDTLYPRYVEHSINAQAMHLPMNTL